MFETLVVGWLLSGIIAGMIASSKHRSGCGFFILGLIFGPLAILAAAVMSRDESAVTRAAVDRGDMYFCPACRTAVHRLASKCPSCRSDLVPDPYPPSMAERLGRFLGRNSSGD